MNTSPRPLRVLHITASSELGGGPEHVWQLVRNLPDGVESFIAAPNREPYWPRFMETVGQSHLFAIPQRRFSLKSFFSLVRWLKAQRIDIIHSHGRGAGMYGRPLALLSGAKSIHTFHGVHPPGSPLRNWVYSLIERTLGRVSRVFISVSHGERDLAVSFLGLPADRVQHIPNGVTVSGVFPNVWGKPFSIVHVTRFDPVKNSSWLVSLACGLQAAGKQCRLVVIGEGEGRGAMQRAVKQAGVEDFFDFVGARQDVRSLMRGAGCYVSASHREGLPLAVLESQAEGVPGVLSDVVGNREAIENDVTGFLYQLNDVHGAVACIARLMEDAELWQRMSVAARQRAKEMFSVERMAEETASCYFQIMQDGIAR
ncbi:glycosyltransferase [Desulfovibrio sp. OttesenSCG-928-O18]|nr:glycosyltransferase [Desulfovibrio sp. OttesenSCG-928-O18]